MAFAGVRGAGPLVAAVLLAGALAGGSWAAEGDPVAPPVVVDPAAGAVDPVAGAVADPALGGAGAAGQPAGLFGAGDVAVSGFSGAKLGVPNLPAGVDPTTLTVIDEDGVSLKVFDLSTLGGPGLGQVVVPPVKFTAKARDIGQVFALTFDDGAGKTGTGAPNLYAAATSLYGLQIVGDPAADGTPTRLKEGSPRAVFMQGQWGSLPGSGPGAIWKIDGQTGAITRIADTAFSGVMNSGPGVGDLAIDRKSRMLYASDLDTGLIHRFDLDANAGSDLGQFDHGMAGRPGAGLPSVADDGKTANILSPEFKADDPSTWGFTQEERRVGALAVRSGRLYYSVVSGPEIWSVGLQPDGSFDTTARREIQVKADKPFAVTDIVFDDQGRMILAQQGAQKSPFDYGKFVEPAQAMTMRYAPAPAGGTELWTPVPDEYAIGLPDGNRMGSGGITLHREFNPDGTIGAACEKTLLTTGDDLRNNPALAQTIPPGPLNVHGFQINDAELVKPQNVPPLAGAFAAYDPNRADPEARGHVGDIEAMPCLGLDQGALPGLPPVTEGGAPLPLPDDFGPLQPGPGGGPGQFALSKQALTDTCTEDGGCAFGITLFNPGPDPLPGPIEIEDVFTANGAVLPGATLIGGPNPPWECTDGPPVTCVHPGPLPVGETVLTLNFKPGPLGDAKTVRNCVAIPGEIGAGGGKADDGAEGAGGGKAEDGADGAGGGKGEDGADDAAGGKGDKGDKGKEGEAEGGKGDQPGKEGEAEGGKGDQPGKEGQGDGGKPADPADKDGDGKPDPVPVPADEGPVVKAVGDKAKKPVNNLVAPPPAKESDKNGLLVKTTPVNADTCTAAKGDCQFKIELINTGNAPIKGPVELTQTTSLGGADVPFSSPSQQLPADFQCKPAEASQTCSSLKDVTIPVGGTFSLTVGVSAKDAVASKAGFVTNKVTAKIGNLDGAAEASQAFVDAPKDDPADPVDPADPADAGDPGDIDDLPPEQCAEIAIENPKDDEKPEDENKPDDDKKDDKPGQLTVAKQAVSQSCKDTDDCKFKILVKNDTDKPIPGPVEFSETVTDQDGALFGATAISSGPTPPWTCVKAGQTFKCTHPGPIAPGATADFDIGVKLGAGSAAKAIKNCVQAQGGEPKCASVPTTPPAPPPAPNLTIKKVAPKADPQVGGVGSCQLQGFCTFDIAITNTSNVPFKGDVVVNDKITGSGKRLQLEGGDGWLCQDPIDNMKSAVCRFPNAELVQNGPPLILKAKVIPGGEKGDTIKNCASLQSLEPEEDNNPQDNESCAAVILDPFSVKSKKTGGQNCQAGGECTFTLTLFNPGPVDHNAPVTLTDKLDIGNAPITSSNIPSTICATPPTTVPFSCTSPGAVPLPVGSSRVFTITVKMPEGATKYTNCATVSDPEGGTKSKSDESCVSYGLEPKPTPTPTPPPPTPTPTPPPTTTPTQCYGNMVADAAGRCACPAGMVFNGRTCAPTGTGNPYPVQPPPVVIPCPAGTYGTYPNCTVGSGNPYPVQQPCPRGTTGVYPNCRPIQVSPPPVIQCPRGTTGVYPNCRVIQVSPPPQCPPGTYGRYPNCTTGGGGSNGVNPGADCPRGTVGVYPNCRPIQIDRPDCPPGTTGRYPRCIVIEQPRCPPGTIGQYPRCRPVQTRDCPSGTTGVFPNCQPIQVDRRCPPGTYGRYPRCRPEQTQQCPSGTTGTYPNCQPIQVDRGCPPGTYGRYPRCRPIRTQECPSGTTGTYPNCQEARRQCPPGTYGRYPRCRQQQETCPNGQMRVRGRCVSGINPGDGGASTSRPDCPAGTRYNRYLRRCVRFGGGGTTNPTPQPKRCPSGLVLRGGECVLDVR